MINIIESDIIQQIKDCSTHTTRWVNYDTAEWINHPKSYPYYYTYGKLFAPKSILEFGVALGHSIQALIAGSGNVEVVYGIDAELYTPHSNTDAKLVLDNAGYTGELVLISGNITDSYTQIPEDMKFDMLSLDCHALNELQIGWNFLAPGGICIIDDLGSSYSVCEPNKHTWVMREIMQFVFAGQVEWFHFVDSLRGQLLVKKKEGGQ